MALSKSTIYVADFSVSTGDYFTCSSKVSCNCNYLLWALLSRLVSVVLLFIVYLTIRKRNDDDDNVDDDDNERLSPEQSFRIIIIIIVYLYQAHDQ